MYMENYVTNKREFKYRTKPTTQCPYKLELTPKTHYVGAGHKAIEIILINSFGIKNIPHCIWWRLSDDNTPAKVYNFQKAYWPVVRRLLKTYSGEVVIKMVEDLKLKFLSPKMIGKYLYWCKITQDKLNKLKSNNLSYNREEPKLQDKPVIDIDKKQDDSLRDWLD